MQEINPNALKLLGKLAELKIQSSEHPEKILNGILKDTATMFAPKNTDQAIDYCMEFVEASAKYAAWILYDHVQDHPEHAVDCCPKILDFMVSIYKNEIRLAFDHLAEWDEFDNPFLAVEPTVNEKTTADILAEIEAEHK